MNKKRLVLIITLLIPLSLSAQEVVNNSNSVEALNHAHKMANVTESSIKEPQPFWSKEQTRQAELEKKYQQAIAAEPENKKNYAYLAGLYLTNNKTAKAIDAYQDAITHDVENPKLFAAISIAYLHQSKFDMAKAMADQALALDPELKQVAKINEYIVAKQEAIKAAQKVSPSADNKMGHAPVKIDISAGKPNDEIHGKLERIIEQYIMKKLKHIGFLSLMLMTLSIICMPLFTAELSAAENIKGADAKRSNAGAFQPDGVNSPGSDLWRNVRQRDAIITGRTQVKGINTGMLIDTKGNEWRKFRREILLPYGGYFLLGSLGIIALLLIFIRKQKIPNGRSGKTVTRMSTMQMVTHWFLVVIVGFMSITGLLLLFGRFVIIPLLGTSAFAPIASASKEGHNLMGPLVASLSKKHLEVGYFNAGEKILFWSTIVLCVLLSISGLLLLFPYYEPTINRTQLALLIHAIAALALIALIFGHIWMVYTVEGTLDAMNTGEVDENWAKSHHSACDIFCSSTYQVPRRELPRVFLDGITALGLYSHGGTSIPRVNSVMATSFNESC
ncbi:Formate dehydrogenase, cytochrome b556(fdo) subunit [Nymphon striatum]|nr:Formate dehydrogenase, cytochrome b556(fdo) subunit [Nymphon striatum]